MGYTTSGSSFLAQLSKLPIPAPHMVGGRNDQLDQNSVFQKLTLEFWRNATHMLIGESFISMQSIMVPILNRFSCPVNPPAGSVTVNAYPLLP